MSGRPPKLTPGQVREIRDWYAAAERPLAKTVAHKYGVHVSTLYGVASGKWHRRTP